MSLDVCIRHAANPVVTNKTLERVSKRPIEGAYNAGAIRLKDGGYAMAARFNYYSQRTGIWWLDSADGVNWNPRPEPMTVPDTAEWNKYADSVIYDPRITRMADTGELLMTVACHSGLGCRIATFRSTDETRTWDFIDYQGIPDHRNTVFFPRKINGLYTVLDRPNTPNSGGNGGGNGGIWLKQSPDLVFWGRADRIVGPGDFLNYGCGGIGAGAPPLETEKGWLCITHAVMPAAKTLIYTVGAIVLDREDPRKVLGISEDPILVPETMEEMIGLVPSVCFPCAAIAEPDQSVKIYYGGADRVTCLATSTIPKLLAACGL